MVSKTHWTEAKSLGLKVKQNGCKPCNGRRTHTISRKHHSFKKNQNQAKTKERTNTPWKLKNIKATLKLKHTFRFLLNFYYPISFSVPLGTLLDLLLRLHWEKANSENEAKSFQMFKYKEAKINATLTCGDANDHCSSGRLRSWWKQPGRLAAKNSWKTKESTFPHKC